MCSQLSTTLKQFDNPSKGTHRGSQVMPRSPPTFLASQSDIPKGRSTEEQEQQALT